nr:GDSL esterase/lipase At1g29670-like [Ipomoea batatas]
MFFAMGSGKLITACSWLVLGVSVVVVAMIGGGEAQPQVPCLFIFGDSLVDNGNNNNINSLAKANYLPYGIDFPRGPTGRFSNGKTTVDTVAQLLGFNENDIPPYARARGQQILRGVNYASAAAGIRDETGQQLGGRTSFSGQWELGAMTILTTTSTKKKNYLNNYFMPLYYSSSRRYTPQQFADLLIQQYTQQLRILYNYGARKFALIGVGQIGCSPNALAQNSADGKTCVKRINDANQMFNNNLRQLVDSSNRNTPDAKFIYVNAYGIFQDLIDNPSAFGEAANIIVGRRSYTAQKPSDAYPYDISRLAQA